MNYVKLKKKKKIVDTEKLICMASEYTYSFKIFRNIKNFCRDTYNDEITWKEADED